MKFDELMKFIEIEDKRIKERYGSYSDEEKRILARAVKLNEEVGELCNEILAHNSLQRKEKMKNYNKENLSSEFADVIITTLLLAKTMNVNIKESLKNKILKMNKRK